MDNKILYTAKFTHHDLKFHKVWWKSDKRFGRINQKFMKLCTLQDPNMKMCTLVGYPSPLSFSPVMLLWTYFERIQFALSHCKFSYMINQKFMKLCLECSQGCYRRTDGSVTISLCNFVGEGIIILLLRHVK
jgi:hypothetical protein